jgi:hypothetical protein
VFPPHQRDISPVSPHSLLRKTADLRERLPHGHVFVTQVTW